MDGVPSLSVRNASGQIFFTMAIITFGLSSILSGLNFLVTVTHLRAPGMTWGRLPIFVWSVIAASILAFTFTQFFAAAMLMITLDRIAGFSFFNADKGGAPLLYQHIFWFYSHPAVYIFVLPGFGITLEVLAHFSRKPLFAYRWAVGGLLGIVVLSGVVWAHHMFVSGMPTWLHAPFLVSTEVISVPTGFVFLSALGTIWMGRIWLRTPMLFALGVIFNFMIGGITGIFLADVPTDINLNATYFVVAHFHYTIIGGEIFALFAGIYYWFPKITGRMYNEKLGQLHFWIMMATFNLTFLPMFYPGLHGMNRRIATYTPELQGINVFISIMAFVMGASFLIFVGNMIYSLVWGPKAAADPWHARTLEWQISSPPPVENFHAIPVVSGSAYDYGVPRRPAARGDGDRGRQRRTRAIAARQGDDMEDPAILVGIPMIIIGCDRPAPGRGRDGERRRKHTSAGRVARRLDGVYRARLAHGHRVSHRHQHVVQFLRARLHRGGEDRTDPQLLHAHWARQARRGGESLDDTGDRTGVTRRTSRGSHGGRR